MSNPELAILDSMLAKAAPDETAALTALLDIRYGDGTIYIRDRIELGLFHKAVKLGLVDSEGYITPTGIRLWRSAAS